MFRSTLFLFLLLLVSCSYFGKETKPDDTLIAEVYTKKLFQSDLGGIVPPEIVGDDSALIVSAYIQRWTREAIMQYEAERNIPKDVDIDQLVRNYRASLLRHNYEEFIMSEKLDSTIMESELRTYYEENKDQFQLDNTIMRAQLLKVPNDAPTKEFNTLWNSSKPADAAKLKTLATQWASVALLDNEKWHTLNSIQNLLPEGALNKDNASNRKEFTLKDGSATYYFRVLELVRDQQPAPYEYARDQALKVLLHRRKQKIMEDWKEGLYQKALKDKEVKIY